MFCACTVENDQKMDFSERAVNQKLGYNLEWPNALLLINVADVNASYDVIIQLAANLISINGFLNK